MQLLKTISSTLVLTGTLLYMPIASALAISDVMLDSHLNQQLKASVDLLSVSPEELDSLVVIVHPLDSDSAASLSWPKIKHEVVSDNSGRHQIKLTSESAIREPVVNFILELSWSGGRLEREFVLLIDPQSN